MVMSELTKKNAEKCLGLVNPKSKRPNLKRPRSEGSNPLMKLVNSSEPSAHAIPLPTCVSLHDIEAAAKNSLSRRAYIYYSSASEDLSSLQNNFGDWGRIRFRPRVLRDVTAVSMTRRIMDFESALPFFIAPMALGRLAHKDGELCFVRGAAQKHIPYCVSSLSSVSHQQLSVCWQEIGCNNTTLFFQLYVAKQEAKAREMIRTAKKLGYSALVVTLDTPVVGKREEDERDKLLANFEAGLLTEQTIQDLPQHGSNTVLRGVNSSTLNWADLKWIQKEWGDRGPIALKGIGSAEDAKMAQMLGFKHVYLSNHGGRQIPSAPSSIATLLDIRHYFPEVLEHCNIYLDGGIRRGSDIVKALCLGATAVAIGRPFMYGLGSFGQAGVAKVVQSKSIPCQKSITNSTFE